MRPQKKVASHVFFPRVLHQNKKETWDPGSKGLRYRREVEGRPRTTDPEQNLFVEKMDQRMPVAS